MIIKICTVKKKSITLQTSKRNNGTGEMAEWSIAAVLKTVEGHTSGGSNPSLSAEKLLNTVQELFSLQSTREKSGATDFFRNDRLPNKKRWKDSRERDTRRTRLS